MGRLLRKPAWRRSSWGTLAAAIGLVGACSSSEKSFFDAPAVVLAGASGNGGGGAVSGNTGGTGNDGSADEGAGAASGADAGGATDATGGSGDTTSMAGEPSSGGTGARGGGSGKGGASATGGVGAAGSGAQGGAAGTAGAALGGTTGVGGDAMAGTAGLAVGGAGSSNLGGMAGTGGGGAGSGGVSGMGGVSGSASCVPTEPSDEICDGVDNDCVGGVDGPGVCPDGCVGAVYGGHRYLLCSGVGDYTYTRQEAHSWCADDFSNATNLTLDLVRIDTEAENDFLLGLIASTKAADPIWIGASDSSQISDQGEGYWVWGPQSKQTLFWVNGSAVGDAFVYWGTDQPDNNASGSGEDCAVFDPDLDWHWNDRSCSSETSTLLCEELDN